MTTSADHGEIAVTPYGTLVIADGMLYFLTSCCGASAKGSQSAVVCRSCYRTLPNTFGWASMADDPQLDAALIEYVLYEIGQDRATATAQAAEAMRSMPLWIKSFPRPTIAQEA